ncbi:MAG TPA: prepilin-type N-terminal cleavage/methylation domain-containing protein [Candidatus Paceibacterota bacterium]|nr:prepilin-type N-terminal cleavage/methylation domain-containing protein [Candidatus Paceibacterota bacterium]
MCFHTKYKIQNTKYRFRGFTLVELLIVIGITATMATVGIGYYMNQQKTKLLETTAQEIVSYLKYAQQKSISQEQGLQWGVHFENPSSGQDFYALYTGTTYSNPIETKYLPEGIEFSIPQTASSVDISFSKLTGKNYSGTNQSVTILSTFNNATTTITVSSLGLVTYQ